MPKLGIKGIGIKAIGNRGYTNEVRLGGLMKIKGFLTCDGGLGFCRCGFNRLVEIRIKAIRNRGYTNEVRLGGLMKIKGFLTRDGGLGFCRCGFNCLIKRLKETDFFYLTPNP